MLEHAKAMLRDELRKQPLLSIFYTTEAWRLPLIAPLVEAGYLAPGRIMTTVVGSCEVYDVTDKARVDLLPQ